MCIRDSSRAVSRQTYLEKVPLPVYSVVLMDEAGLPAEDDMESLKVLHYHLDEPKVSFVAISNHILDAAKTNRAVSLFRPKASHKELCDLVQVSIGLQSEQPSDKSKKLVSALVRAYEEIQNVKTNKEEDLDFNRLFGLRDFIFFVTYLRRNTKDVGMPLDMQIIVEGLERNFNGTRHFAKLCRVFLSQVSQW